MSTTDGTSWEYEERVQAWSTCPLCGASYNVARGHACSTVVPYQRSTSPPAAGWECPRCRKINAPWRSQCDCVPPLIGGNTQDAEVQR